MVGAILEIVSEATAFESRFQVGYHFAHRTYYTLCTSADVLDLSRH